MLQALSTSLVVNACNFLFLIKNVCHFYLDTLTIQVLTGINDKEFFLNI